MFYSVERRKHLSLLNFMTACLNRFIPQSAPYPISEQFSNNINQPSLSSTNINHTHPPLSHYSAPAAQNRPISPGDRYQNIEKWE